VGAGVEILLLGPVAVLRDGAEMALPRSRKVRALLAFLALGRAPVARSRLCDLLWDVPNDPRSELRWCLSKLRSVLDDEERRRVVTPDQGRIALDLSDCLVDALDVDRTQGQGIGGASTERLAALCARFRGDLLAGVEIDGNPEFTGWLAAQRQHYRSVQIAALRELASRAAPGSNETFRWLQAWLALAPFDPCAHQTMLEALLRSGRLRDADKHLAATLRAFENEGLDVSALRQGWQAARALATPAASVELARGDPAANERTPKQRRASVAVMPFVDVLPGQTGRSRMADGLTDDIITRLAKLRALFVIARGSVYALSERGIGPQEAARILNVEYIASGSVRRQGGRVSVLIELVQAEDARIVWTDEFEGSAEEALGVLDSIVGRIVAAIAEEIEAAECNRAVLKPANSLDAWEAYHRGLWHMYKFNGPDNRDAGHFFRRALELDATFARAYAGLSFTHFQNAFLDLTPDRDRQIDLALEAATRSLGADQRDPAAQWAMGRALWLRGENKEAFAALERSIELSPNFALGHYTLGFVHSQMGDPRSAIDATTTSRQLSPFDPLQFAMLASRALAHVRLGEAEEAADWAVKATSRPNAHAHILAIAVECLLLSNRKDEARVFVGRIRERVPTYSVEDFLRAFRFPKETESVLRRCARLIGFDGR
jgi:DNA-binding SARP family transcriptional activator/tetratricopeptide (TPR) repeat protein